MVMTPTFTTGLDRARPVAPRIAHPASTHSWRDLGSMNPCGTTGLTVADVYTPNLPAGAFEQTIKRPTRPLGTRST